MNRRQKIIVTVTGIFIVLLALLGLTFAYFLTQIRGNGETKSISVTTANLLLEYGNDDGSIIGEGEFILPGTTFSEKTFTVTNNGTATVENYAVVLEDVKTYYTEEFKNELNQTIAAGTQTEFVRPEDFEIKIECKKKDGKDCNGMSGTLPLMENQTNPEIKYITNGVLLTNSIEKDDVHTYKAVLTYKETDTDQSADMNKTLEGKFNIIDANNTIDLTGTVTNYNAGDIVQTNSTKRTSQINSDGTYKIVGLEAGTHSVKLVSDSETEISKLSIKKGTTASVGETTIDGVTVPEITITDNSRLATLNIDANTKVIETEETIENYNPYKKGTLAYNIIKNAMSGNEGSTGYTLPSQLPSKIAEEASSTVKGVEKTIEENIKNILIYGNSEEDILTCLNNQGENCPEGTTLSAPNSCSDIINKYFFEPSLNRSVFISECENDTINFKINVESLLSFTEDDLGTSYYYRGNVEDNYVNFAGMCWRIVRIAGDGSTKLILEDQHTTCNDVETETTPVVYTGDWNIGVSEFGFDAEIGLNYLTSSKSMAKDFYNFQKSKLKYYENKLKSGDWCLNDTAYTRNDTAPYKYTLINKDTDKYKLEEFYYDSYVRLSGENEKGYQPTLKCNGTVMDKFKSVTYNGSEIIKESPMYVATATADEIVFAGGTTKSSNQWYYLTNDYFSWDAIGWWTMSPKMFKYADEYAYSFSDHFSTTGLLFPLKLRPMISLIENISATTKTDTTMYGQPGTITNPYVIN